jgi:sulfate adenylyltransferase (ADP) / ATP adenylyltransferase
MMSERKLILKPGTLWTRMLQQTEYALQSGALQPIATEYGFVAQDGVNFLVRILGNIVRKDEAREQQDKKSATSGQEFNPFLPYEQDLFVTDISETHLCLLNKFNVVDYHLLIVTRAFEEQESLLTLADFEALWASMAEFDGLAFYNGGTIAGASQRHKHLQLVPLPLIPNPNLSTHKFAPGQAKTEFEDKGNDQTGFVMPSGAQFPIEPLLCGVQFQDLVGTIPQLPFVHAIAKLNPSWVESPLEAAQVTFELYHTLRRALGLQDSASATGKQQSGAYNLIATREWMLIVPRQQECFESISVNSLGFAGALLVKNPQQMKILQDLGPMNLLKQVAIATIT